MYNATLTLDSTGLASLQERVARLTKRTKKLGLADPVLVIEQTDANEFRVTISMETPTIGRYLIIATVQHHGLGVDGQPHNTVNVAAECDHLVPAEARTATHARCDHCGVFRYRKSAVVVRDTETDETLVIGTSCMKDYVGGRLAKLHAPTKVVKLLNDFREVAKDMETWQPTEHRAPVLTVDFLAKASALIKLEGYASMRYQDAHGEGSTTGERTWVQWEDITPDADDEEIAAIALDWIRGEVEHANPKVATRLSNAKTACSFEHILRAVDDAVDGLAFFLHHHGNTPKVPAKPIGVFEDVAPRPTASSVRETLTRPRRDLAPATYKVGARVEVAGRLERFFRTRSQYGDSHLVAIDPDNGGPRVCAFARGLNGRDFRIGDRVVMLGTVKSLDPYQGHPQVMLNRVRIELRA